MDYSNESFECFQSRLQRERDCPAMLWELRDSLFCEAFYGSNRRSRLLFGLPFGSVLQLLLSFFKDGRRGNTLSRNASSETAHFLFPSDRNNHLHRLYPLFSDRKRTEKCLCWMSNSAVVPHVRPEDREMFVDASNQWIRSLKLRDLRDARALACRMKRIFGGELRRWQIRKINLFLIQFFAWSRFWRRQFQMPPEEIYCTFEKSPVGKAFFVVGKELSVGKRVHWVHGLRHASLQATAATELWCMTEGDVEFFKPRVPDYCTPMAKRNPEADILIETVGMRNPTERDRSLPVDFLFLGPGIERSYTDSMRVADLAVIKSVQVALGAQVQWRFRPHPSAVDRFRTELAEAGIEANDFSANTLNEDLSWADAVGSSWSSLLLDVRETGRPIFWVQSEIRNLGGVDELIRDGIGIHASRETLARELTEIFQLATPG